MKIRWLAIACSDLEHLYQYGAQGDLDAADSEVAKVMEAAENLTKMSGLGRPGRVPDTRELVISQYIVAYRARAGRGEVLRVLHQAQRWPDMMG